MQKLFMLASSLGNGDIHGIHDINDRSEW